MIEQPLKTFDLELNGFKTNADLLSLELLGTNLTEI